MLLVDEVVRRAAAEYEALAEVALVGVPAGISSVPVRGGVALRRGALAAHRTCRLVNGSTGSSIDAAVSVFARWPDGSARWLFIEFAAALGTTAPVRYFLQASTEQVLSVAAAAPKKSFVRPLDGGRTLCVDDGLGTDVSVRFGCYLVDELGERHPLLACGFDPSQDGANLVRDVAVSFAAPGVRNASTLTIELRVTAMRSAGILEFELCPHNTAAALHPKGLWDLGEPASIRFRELGIALELPPDSELHLDPGDGGSAHALSHAAEIELDQLSSGGANRHSEVHVDAQGKVPSLPEGYSLKVDNKTLATGARAEPSLRVGYGPAAATVRPRRFWQEFPTSLRVSDATIEIALFARTPAGSHELQPGERKRRSVAVHQASGDGRFRMPLVVRGGAGNAHAEALFGRALELHEPFDLALRTLVASPEAFAAKRERFDEYGWRHFGDVPADHESLYLAPGSFPLVSHYNNQYDLVLGFGLQFVRTGDPAWFDLMDDLARHVVDIDIYRTDNDRVEYNNGLFWHTSHYRAAGTATHRSFSVRGYDPAEPAGNSGGPAQEHCYTTGLLLHYRLTGDPDSADAVLRLADWMDTLWDGDGTVLDRLYRIARDDLRAVREALRGERPSPYRYRVYRGTGNLVVALLDAFELVPDRRRLDRAGWVLRNAFHEGDDPAGRGLGDIEAGWSYTVFLQAALRFLAVKEELGEIDHAYAHVRRAYMAYVRWVRTHQRPYLETPDELEFPNDTWAAQDLRRHALMLAAARYDPDDRAGWRDAAARFGEPALQLLARSGTREFARIQAIILWNLGLSSDIARHPDLPALEGALEVPEPAPSVNLRTIAAGSLRSLRDGASSFDPAAECRWLRRRLR